MTDTVKNTSINNASMEDNKINKDNDDSFKSNIYFGIVCITMFMIIIIFIVSILKINKEDSIMKKYRNTYSEKTSIQSNNISCKTFHDSRIPKNVYK